MALGEKCQCLTLGKGQEDPEKLQDQSSHGLVSGRATV